MMKCVYIYIYVCVCGKNIYTHTMIPLYYPLGLPETPALRLELKISSKCLEKNIHPWRTAEAIDGRISGNPFDIYV